MRVVSCLMKIQAKCEAPQILLYSIDYYGIQGDNRIGAATPTFTEGLRPSVHYRLGRDISNELRY